MGAGFALLTTHKDVHIQKQQTFKICLHAVRVTSEKPRTQKSALSQFPKSYDCPNFYDACSSFRQSQSPS